MLNAFWYWFCLPDIFWFYLLNLCCSGQAALAPIVAETQWYCDRTAFLEQARAFTATLVHFPFSFKLFLARRGAIGGKLIVCGWNWCKLFNLLACHFDTFCLHTGSFFYSRRAKNSRKTSFLCFTASTIHDTLFYCPWFGRFIKCSVSFFYS